MELDLDRVVTETVLCFWRAGSLPGKPETLNGLTIRSLVADLLTLRRVYPGIRLSDLLPEEVLVESFRA